MKKTIKQKILDHLNSGFTLTYGQANTITNSQSGYRRFQEILKDNPENYEYVKVKSENGGYYNVFTKKSKFYIEYITGSCGLVGGYVVLSSVHEIFLDTISKTRKEARAKIKKVVR
jgi:hypothetical protein